MSPESNFDIPVIAQIYTDILDFTHCLYSREFLTIFSIYFMYFS